MDSKATLRVVLDHDDGFVRAQSWLKGNITVNYGENDSMATTHPSSASLTVQVVGEESTAIIVRMGRTQKSKHIVFDETVVVNVPSFDKALTSTTRTFPFSVYLPANVPPSMNFEDKHGRCSVQYVVIATLGADLAKESCRLTVIGKPLSCKHYPFGVEPTCLPLKTMAGVVDHGCLVLAARVDSCHVAKGRTVTFSVSCRNKSKEVIERFDIQVLERIWWKAGKFEHEETVKLNSWCDVDIQGLKPFLAADLHAHYPQNPSEILVDSVLNTEMKEEMQSKLHEYQVQIPMRAFSSHAGTLTRVTHALRILASTKHHNLNHHDPQHVPSIYLPLEVFDPPMESRTLRQRSPSPDKATQVIATTVWPKEEDLTTAKENLSSSPAHRKSHSDTEFSYDSISEDVVPVVTCTE